MKIYAECHRLKVIFSVYFQFVDPFLISQLDTKVKEKNTIFNTVK